MPVLVIRLHRKRSQLVSEPPFSHHVAGQLSGLLNVIGCTGCHALTATHEFFGDTSTK